MTARPAFPLPTLVSRLRAAGEMTRLRLLILLAEGELTVSELTQILGQSQPRVSRHLKLLVEAELVERLPEGAWVFYRLADGAGEGSAGALLRRLLGEIKGRDPVIEADRGRRVEVTAARARAAAQYFEANAQEWDRIRSLHISESLVEAAMLALLGPKPIDLLLDLGTGTGRVLEVLAPLCRRAIGFDISHAMLSIARVNLERTGVRHAHVRHGDLYSVPLAPQCADAVVLHQVLHYLDNPGAAIQSAARLLAPGGRLLVVDFAPHTLEYLREEQAHRRLGFSDDQLARWFADSGLVAAQIRHLDPEHPGEGLTVSLWLAQEAQPAHRSLELTA